MKRGRSSADLVHFAALAVILVLIGLSLVTQSNADWYSGDAFYGRQISWFLIGGIAFIVTSMVDLRILERLAWPVYGLCIVGLIITMFFGTEVNNSQRWLRFLGINVQVSEFTKVAVVLAMARLFHARHEHNKDVADGSSPPMGARDLLMPTLLVLVPFLMVVTQPDLGTSLVIAMVAFSMVLYEGLERRTAAVLVVVALVTVPTAWQYGGIRDYQKDRVRLWVNPDWFKVDEESGAIAEGRNLQSEQAVWAIGSGKFWGRGSRSGAQSRLKYLPEMHTDMIIATFAEERGFLGCTMLLGLYWTLLLWGFRIAKDARDTFCAQFAVGMTAIVGWQVFINVGMVAGLLPIVGLPLPFLSYGGSAAVTLLAGLGLLFNVGMKRGRL